MAKRVQEEVFFIALQDGRYDDKEYTTYKEAEAARKEISKVIRPGTCIMSYWRNCDG